MPVCYLCGEEKGEILLMGKLRGDAEAPRRAVFDYEPCDKCKGHMKQGVIFISCLDGTEDKGPEAYRTGGFWVIKPEALGFIQPDELRESILKSRVCFIPDSAAREMGLSAQVTTDDE